MIRDAVLEEMQLIAMFLEAAKSSNSRTLKVISWWAVLQYIEFQFLTEISMMTIIAMTKIAPHPNFFVLGYGNHPEKETLTTPKKPLLVDKYICKFENEFFFGHKWPAIVFNRVVHAALHQHLQLLL